MKPRQPKKPKPRPARRRRVNPPHRFGHFNVRGIQIVSWRIQTYEISGSGE